MNPYIKYSGLAFQLIVMLWAGYYIGGWLGVKAGFSETNGAAAGLLIFLVAGMYRIIREVNSENP